MLGDTDTYTGSRQGATQGQEQALGNRARAGLFLLATTLYCLQNCNVKASHPGCVRLFLLMPTEPKQTKVHRVAGLDKAIKKCTVIVAGAFTGNEVLSSKQTV